MAGVGRIGAAIAVLMKTRTRRADCAARSGRTAGDWRAADFGAHAASVYLLALASAAR